MNATDDTREELLLYLYERNRDATSLSGKRGSQVKISDMKRDLKERHGLTQQEVVSNLTYLIDSGWVTHVKEQRTFRTKSGTEQPATAESFQISAAGIDKVEGPASVFKAKGAYAQIDINAIQSTIALGDGNVVNATYRDLRNEVTSLEEAVQGSDEMDAQTKLEVTADIESLKQQLAKPEPDRGVIRALWQGIEKTTTAGEFGALVTSVGRQLGPLLT